MTSNVELTSKVRRLEVLVRQLQSHTGVSSLLTLGVFGDGSDGNVNLDGTQDYDFATRVGTTYTLTRDIYSTALTIGSTVTVVPAGCRFFVRGGKLTNNGTISAVGVAAAALPNPSAAVPPVGVGKLGGSGRTVAGAVGSAGSFGAGNGGAGGAGSNAGGAITGVGAPASYLRLPMHALTGAEGGQNMGGTSAGGGGGGGGGGDGTNSGGNGGNGGGMIVIFAQSIVNNGWFIAKGGAGGTPTVGNTGGGGGGGGGVVVAYTLQAWSSTGSVDVSGGAGGGGSGTGAAGQPGAAGTVISVVLA